ncbi:MAG: hypothetical protein IPG45_24960 [Deltaproteobacteria bacterium]|nr:hypothetical protein [Deltaproteobacteria bacterium]
MSGADPKVAWGLLVIAGSTALAVLVILAWRDHSPTRIEPAPIPPGVLEPSEIDRAVPTGVATVPAEILDTAERRAAPYAPGLRLLSTERGAAWEQHRANIRDEATGDVRSYSIGDLLPHGSLLVGLSTGSAEVMVADRNLVRLYSDGRLLTVEDFRTADEAKPLLVIADRDQAYRAGALDALTLARSDDPDEAQRAIDQLIDAGEPVIEVLITRVDSLLPTPGHSLCFPSETGRCYAATIEGDLVVGLLERLTGQSFGDVTAGTPQSHREIHRAWLRWWGLE